MLTDFKCIAMATEVELKLYCSPEEIGRIESHPLIAPEAEQGPPKFLENTYFDTPTLALYQERIALRLRTTPAEQLQTVKCAAESVAGLSSRPEWETPHAGTFDFSGVDVAKVRSFLEERKPELVPVFNTSFERRTWRMEVSRNIAILVMVDQGRITSGDHVLPISEVELELVQGKPEDLLDFAIGLATHLPLVPHNVSKAERGYQQFLNQEAAPQKAAPSPLSVTQTTAEAFCLLATQGMQMWQANLLGTLTSSDPEFVHQFRVALRRLNCLIKVFKPVLPDRFRQQWTKKLKELSQITGGIRDLEVMQSCILQPILHSGDQAAQAHVSAVLVAHDKARQAALAEMRQLSDGGAALRFARDIQELSTDDFPKNLPFAEKKLSGLYSHAVKRMAKALKSPAPDNVHRFRIALKHLRYSCEFFAPLFDNEEITRYAKTIAKLQDEFGFVNDFHVALSRLQTWVEQGDISTDARQAIAAWHRARAQETQERALHLAESVLGACLPWCTECERRGLSQHGDGHHLAAGGSGQSAKLTEAARQ
jgi:adenylate cyclase